MKEKKHVPAFTVYYTVHTQRCKTGSEHMALTVTSGTAHIELVKLHLFQHYANIKTTVMPRMLLYSL